MATLLPLPFRQRTSIFLRAALFSWPHPDPYEGPGRTSNEDLHESWALYFLAGLLLTSLLAPPLTWEWLPLLALLFCFSFFLALRTVMGIQAVRSAQRNPHP